jgi:hypothetical protein
MSRVKHQSEFLKMVSVVAGTFFYGFRRWLFNGFRRSKKRFLMVSVLGCLMVSVAAGNVF